MTHPLLFDGTWAQQWKYESAEAFYQEVVSGNKATTPTQGSSQTGSGAAADQQVLARLKALETENNNLKKASQDLTALVKKLETRVVALEKSGGSTPAASSAPKTETKPAAKDDDEDSDFDPFGDDSDSDDEETKKRLAEYAAKKDKKPVLIAKSSLLIDVKPWDDETDMAELERLVRTVTIDGLLWGASKLVPVGYGIKKLQINAVIEDDKVSTDALEEAITGFEDHVQSMDIAAFNKI
ncbi:elongation factor 1-delta-like isoform X2 [Dreissena polymorpha]|uniref:elongation factor 1-delta-like isoform X2 n=1 Tax=Dreissena polymorpha TaxID=45954 RepID=UPI00226499D2|nr:elongation factor 1-delta-like isoform X2 [Dreissena polymorpha]